MNKIIYPAVFHVEEEGYSVDFPDLLGCVTEGETLSEALEMAQDALGLYLFTLEQDNKALPESTNPADIKMQEKEFISLIEWDRIEYLKKVDNKAVKKTLTIPSWLNYLAEEKNVNFSQILQEALKEQLVK